MGPGGRGQGGEMGRGLAPGRPEPELFVRQGVRGNDKTTAGHQHCNFLTYNKAISYFLPYKWK